MRTCGQVLKKYWYLFLVTLLLILPGTYGVMVGVWIIGSMTKNIVIGAVISAALGALMVTLPILGVGMNPKYPLRKSTSLIIWGSSVVVCFSIFVGMGATVVLR